MCLIVKQSASCYSETFYSFTYTQSTLLHLLEQSWG